MGNKRAQATTALARPSMGKQVASLKESTTALVSQLGDMVKLVPSTPTVQLGEAMTVVKPLEKGTKKLYDAIRAEIVERIEVQEAALAEAFAAGEDVDPSELDEALQTTTGGDVFVAAGVGSVKVAVQKRTSIKATAVEWLIGRLKKKQQAQALIVVLTVKDQTRLASVIAAMDAATQPTVPTQVVRQWATNLKASIESVATVDEKGLEAVVLAGDLTLAEVEDNVFDTKTIRVVSVT